MASEFAGALRRHLSIERFQLGRDAQGQVTGAWVTAGALWGAMTPVNAAEGNAPPRFRVDSRAQTIDPACRLTGAGRAYQVLSVGRDPNQPARMRLLVEEVTP